MTRLSEIEHEIKMLKTENRSLKYRLTSCENCLDQFVDDGLSAALSYVCEEAGVFPSEDNIQMVWESIVHAQIKGVFDVSESRQ